MPNCQIGKDELELTLLFRLGPQVNARAVRRNDFATASTV